jgi:molybdopterin-guanine dinucleotide biosynthesis protein B
MCSGTKLLGVVGHSGAGKTTLLEELVPFLRARGMRVGVLKHDAHRIEFDKAGKDSFRLRESGAEAVAVVSKDMIFLQAPPPADPCPERLIELLFGGMDLDLVLLEGYSSHPHPKVEVLHPFKGARCDPERDGVIARVFREERPSEGPPAFCCADLSGLVHHLQGGQWLPQPVPEEVPCAR